MPRPSEIAADARALYGPLDLRPAAGDLGDGALWVDPGSDGALYQVQSGNWVRIAGTGATGALGAAPAGVPVLHGPYVVDYTDLPHDGDTMTLWTPQVGDVLLRLFCDPTTVTQWDHGNLYVGQDVDATASPPVNFVALGILASIGQPGPSGSLDNLMDQPNSNTADSAGDPWGSTAYVFDSTDPVQIQLAQVGENPDPSQGHVELYALVARAVAP